MSMADIRRMMTAQRIPALLAVLWAVPFAILAFTGAPFGTLPLVVPMLLVAVLVWFRPLAARIAGLILAGMLTFLFVFGSAEEGVFSSVASDHTTPIALQFLFGFVWGALVCLAILISLFLSRRRRLSLTAGLSFLLAAYWLGIFLVDTFLSANLPGMRWLLAPLLTLVFFVVGFLMWRPLPLLILSLALSSATLLATTIFWITYAPLLTMGGTFPPAIPGEYATALPWPLVLVLALLGNLGLEFLLLRSYMGHSRPISGHASSA